MSEFGDLSLDGGQILSSQKPRSPPHLLLLKVFKVDTLLSISGGQNGGQDDVTILSPVVSLFAKNFNNRFLPLGLNLTMRHLVATDKKKVCEFFLLILQTNTWNNGGSVLKRGFRGHWSVLTARLCVCCPDRDNNSSDSISICPKQ